ncbi:Dus-domain-containing protein [Marasmius fiardii PR-910]|nr:Dus-domain-containing protein [Marasmius fiardii PR-910]
MASTSNPEQKKPKLGGYEFYRQLLGSPKYIVAPMVDQSELAWRKLSRRYGAQLIYTPMINAKMWAEPKHISYRTASFDIASNEEGNPAHDRPLIIQFCGNDPEKLLKAAKDLEPHCDAVDINLGCPQDIAKKGKYGAFLMDDLDLVYRLINILHENLSIPVTAKFRVFPTVEKTVEYAKMLERAGAQILTCHGRLREQRGQNAGLADWSKIRAVKSAVSVPVFANGNILFQSDIQRCLEETGCDGVMSAEGQLYNVALFNGLSTSSSDIGTASVSTTTTIPVEGVSTTTAAASLPESTHSSLRSTPITPINHPPHADLALEYLSIVHSLRTRTAISAIKGHLFKILRPALGVETDLRERLGKVKVDSKRWEGGGSVINTEGGDEFEGSPLWEYVEICREMKSRMDRVRDEALSSGSLTDGSEEELVVVDSKTGVRVLPCWLAQPYVRGVPGGVGKAKETVKEGGVVVVKAEEAKESPVATTSISTSIPKEAEAETVVTPNVAVPSKRSSINNLGGGEDVGKRVKLCT